MAAAEQAGEFLMKTSRALALAIAASLAAAAFLAPAISRSLAQVRMPAEPDMPMGWNFKNLSPEQQQRMLRFSAFVNKKVPEEYLTAENTIGYTTNAIAAGGPLYVANCAKCHGTTGLGNGELAYSLNPSPALLAYLIQQPIAIDQYLLWTISEGGEQFGTAMPSFKNELSQDQIWQIVAYLRAGFPTVGDAPKPVEPPPAKTDDPEQKP
jgi:mono/diheme cytochrome c family protein